MKKINTTNKFYFDYKLCSGICVLLFLSFKIENEYIAYASSEYSSHCSKTFLSIDDSNTPTNSFIRYLVELYEAGDINSKDLTKFLDHLKQGKIINPIDSEKANSNPDASIQEETIDEFLLQGNIQTEELIRWISSRLESELQIQTARSDISILTEITHYPMVFYPVEIPRRFLGITLPHFIKKPSIIEVASTQLTEMQWYEVMGDVIDQKTVRHYHQTETNGVFVLNRNGEKVLMFPNHPVTAITIWSALVFANTLSLKHNLEPAYNLSDIDFERNSYAGDGSLQSTNYRISEVPIFNYKANGYRILSRDERNYLIGIRFIPWIAGGFSTRRFEEACNNAWLKHNSDDKIREVALHRPTLIDNHPFFDLIGNTSELEQVVEIYREGNIKPDQINSAYVHFFVSGGSFRTHKEIIRVMLDNNQNPRTFASSWCTGDEIRGFRFVRTIKPELH